MRNQNLGRLSAEIQADINSLLAWPSIQQRRPRTGDTLAILERIGKEAEPPAIAHLMSFALALNGEVRAKSRPIIRGIFDRMPIDLLPLLDESLRRSWSQLQYWYGLKPREAKTFRPHSQDDWLFLALLSCHRDGFVCVEAVQNLGAAPPEIAIPFLMIRMVDWVREVRLAADEKLLEQMKPAHGKVFVDCLGLLDRLSSNSRYRVGYTTSVEGFLKVPEQAEALAAGLHSAVHSVRRRSFILALENPGLSKKSVIEKALNHPDVVVRKWAFQEGPLHSPGDSIDWTARAATDPYGPIRRTALTHSRQRLPSHRTNSSGSSSTDQQKSDGLASRFTPHNSRTLQQAFTARPLRGQIPKSLKSRFAAYPKLAPKKTARLSEGFWRIAPLVCAALPSKRWEGSELRERKRFCFKSSHPTLVRWRETPPRFCCASALLLRSEERR